MKTPSQNPDYQQFIHQVKNRIRTAQYEALRKVNQEHIQLYWDLGKMILEKQNEKGWGKSVVEQIARDLQDEFAGVKGFSKSNLWRMRSFYQTYHQNSNLAPLVREIGWSHNVAIVEKCKNDQAREFYLLMTKKFGWTKAVLIHNIENSSYEKYLHNQHNFDQTLAEKYKDQAILALKDEYQFDFLGLGPAHSEQELEINLIKNIRKFLGEMGGYFSFIGQQYRLEVGNQEYFIDLLLFHRRLSCLVAIELKIGEFTPEMAGKMQFYLNVLNDQVREAHENPSLGIIICKSKNRTIVEYALRDSKKPIGVATYTLEKQLPKEWQGLLPSPEQLKKHFLLIENLKL
ncbi:MAG: PDDEXK nuclease domain-containing protein [Bacteroidota bacterium]